MGSTELYWGNKGPVEVERVRISASYAGQTKVGGAAVSYWENKGPLIPQLPGESAQRANGLFVEYQAKNEGETQREHLQYVSRGGQNTPPERRGGPTELPELIEIKSRRSQSSSYCGQDRTATKMRRR